MKRLQATLTREAVRAIVQLRSACKPKDALTAIRGLPLLLRRHGLLATLGHFHNGGDAAEASVAAGFVGALAQVAPFTRPDAPGRVRELAEEPLAAYLLHSRLALAMADAWVRVAEALLDEGGAARNAPRESANCVEAERAPA